MPKKNNKIRDNDPESEREINLYDNPIPSRELILQVMSEHGVPINKKSYLRYWKSMTMKYLLLKSV